MTCKNCNKTFSCGCQKTIASDKAIVHKTCLKEYETFLSTANKK